MTHFNNTHNILVISIIYEYIPQFSKPAVLTEGVMGF